MHCGSVKHFIYVKTRQEQITLVSKKLISIKTTLMACLPITCTYVITVNRAELCAFSFARNTIIRDLILNETETAQ